MRVVHVASELAPFAQSGGLADVLAGLPTALANSHGLEVAVVVPLYRGVADKVAGAGLELGSAQPIALEVGPHALTAAIRKVMVGRVVIGFVDCAALYDRNGTLYGPGGTGEFTDNHVRFGALGKAALAAGPLLLGGAIDVLHVHDWQATPAALFAHVAGRSAAGAIVTTIHNLAFRGIFPKTAMDELGLPWSLFDQRHLEFYDQVCLLKGGLAVADAVTTVSPSYAREILTPERGEALDGFLRWDVKRLVGIVNGIDARAWNPATDPAIAAPFSRDDLTGKSACRRALELELGFAPDDPRPIIGVISRMADQKGVDLVADIAPELSRIGARLVVLGAGEPALEARFRWLAERFADHVAVRIGFDPALARRIYAGSDLFAMPSRFEPCGLGQLYAMRYGSIPIVHAVGGLRDTVIDPTALPFGSAAGRAQVPAIDPTALPFGRAAGRAQVPAIDPTALPFGRAAGRAQVPANDPTALPFGRAAGRAQVPASDPGDSELALGHGTGIRFEPITAAALSAAIERGVAVVRDPDSHRAVQRAAMARDSSWTASAQQYVQLYRSLI